ncbi:MAG: hypothetical protein JSU77_03020 [Fidelibacterota bacterium]|nr:MAG: hypothetical protein JSU77_03020 [Candidatus Neomarinimicrobiota bacterium]
MNGDTSTRQEQLTRLNEKVNALVVQVEEGYGEALLEQLIHRMELTVRDFVIEVDGLVERLKQSATTQEELLGKIKSQDTIAGPAGLIPQVSPEEEVPEWEQRLADLEKSAK